MSATGPSDFSPSSIKKLDPAKYTSLSDYINEVNKPDNRDALVKTYGNQGITGFLQMVGATKSSGSADEVQYWEETRLHQKQTGTLTTAAAQTANASVTFTVTTSSDGTNIIRENDVVLINGEERGLVTAVSSATNPVITIKSLDGVFGAVSNAAKVDLPVVGNLYGQGTDQPSEYLESNVVKRTNPYMIIKDIFKVTGSQATNIGWINLGNGDYRWYVKGEQDTRQRFMDKREMMMLLGEKVANTNGITDLSGSEGYFAAIQNRGINHADYIETLADLDTVVKQFDKQGAGSEYALYVNRDQDLKLDDMLATANLLGSTAAASGGLTGAGSAAYGAFNNSAETAISLGFKSFSRGGYTFHKHDWKLLNDPTLLGSSEFKGVAIPMSTVVDPQSGDRNPSLEMNFKNTNGYSREMEHWITGSFMGATNDTKDVAQFNYRSEMCLVTRAANRHMLIK
jgi:hypothetical protein